MAEVADAKKGRTLDEGRLMEFAHKSGFAEMHDMDDILKTISKYRPRERAKGDTVRILLVGSPASGKSTIASAYSRLRKNEVVQYDVGPEMTKIAAKMFDVDDPHDRMRDMPIGEQLKLQAMAVREIDRGISEDVDPKGKTVLITTHPTVATGRDGFMAGLNSETFDHYKPDAIVFLYATPKTLSERAIEDKDRVRDMEYGRLNAQQDLNLEFIKLIRAYTGLPVLFLKNEGTVTEAAMRLYAFIEKVGGEEPRKG